MADETETTEALAEAVRGPSAVLSEAREKLGLSQKEVADKLYLTTTFIKYIDAGEFDRIPKPAFVRGYLRSYARVVELSGDLIVELYEKELQLAEPTPEIKGVTEEKVGTAHITGPVLQTGVIGLALLFLVIGLVWWLVSDDEPETTVRVVQPSLNTPEPEQQASEAFDYVIDAPDTTTEPETELEGGAAQMQFGDDEPEVTSGQVVDVVDAFDETPEPELEVADEVAEVVTEDAQADDVDGISIERNFDGERNFIAVDAGGFDELTLSFTDECWVEISDGQNDLVYHDLNRDADVLTIYGTLPFRVLLGKATGVEMLYNGRPFDLEPYIGPDKTAKLTISE